jgi:hypothetical protein
VTPTGKYVVGGVGALGIIGTAIGLLVAKKTAAVMQNAVAGKDAAGTPVLPPGAGVSVPLRLTHYYPFAAATAAERKMEGGTNDRKGRPLRTVEDFLAGKSEYVSLAGDWTLWPDGQKILIPWGDKTLVGRVVDTGGHFFGSKKVIRATGYEPIDVCVFDKNNRPPKSLVTGRVVSGDFFEKSKVTQPLLAAMGKPYAEVGCGFDILGVA